MRAACLAALAFFLFFSTFGFAQSEDWLPVTPQDQQIKEVPGNPGAPAIQLYYANQLHDNEGYEFYYKRIKILNESGKQYADVEISGTTESKVTNLKARTIHPDGSIVEFTGKPFDKTIFKGRGFKLAAKAFTMPDVTIGSIIEYKYRLDYYWSDTWVLQHDLFTVKEFVSFEPSQYGQGLSWVGRNLQDHQPVKKSGRWEMQWDNVPAFEVEANMPPERIYKPTIQFYYVRYDITGADKFWVEIGKYLNDYYGRYIGNRKEIREAAAEAIGTETDPEKKLRKLYERAQQVKNLSYEREMTQQERKKEKIKTNENLGDIVKRGYGDSDDITAFFVGMARASGFEASLLLASSRREDFFSDKLLSLSNFGGRVAQVNLNGKELYLQPGVRYCPFGLLHWTNTSSEALRFDKKGGAFVMVPGLGSDRSLTHRTAAMDLSEEGALHGDITIEFNGEEALQHRLDSNGDDDASRKKDLEDELKNWLPTGAVVKLVKVDGWDSPNEPLVAHFTLDLPDFAVVAGKRVLLPSLLFQSQQKDAFKHAERKYPVYFPYAFSERDRVSIKLPPGYVLESLPPRQDLKLDFARYQTAAAFDGKQFVTERAFAFNAIFVQLARYPELKEFMSKVKAGDEQQAVLKMGVTTNAEKTN
jgi:hypothetical protein